MPRRVSNTVKFPTSKLSRPTLTTAELTRHKQLMMWPHLACASPVVLASCLATSGVQSCMPRASVVVRSSAGILNWRHQPGRWQWPSPSQISSWQDLRCTTHPQYVRRRVSLLLVCVRGTVCRRRYLRGDLATDYFSENRKNISVWT